jgi:pyruvate kinase
MRWGVTPMTTSRIENVDDFFAIGERLAKQEFGLKPGSLVVLVAGLPIGIKGSTNLLRVLTVS